MDKELVRLSLKEICKEWKSDDEKRKNRRNNENNGSVINTLAEKSTDMINKEFNQVNSQNNLTVKEVIELENFSTTVAEKLYEIPMSVLSLCEQALCKRQCILEWLHTLLFNNGCTINSDEFASKMHELTSENEELAMSYNVAMTRLRRGVANTMDLLQKIYLERDLLKERNENLSVEIAELQTMNNILEHRLVASNGDQPAKEARMKELEVELKNEKNRKAIFRDRLQKADARSKVRNEELKETLMKLENSDMQRSVLAQKLIELEKEYIAMEKKYQEQMEKSKASFEANLKKLDKINEHVGQLEQLIWTQRQQLETQSRFVNEVSKLEADNKNLREVSEKYECQMDTMEQYTRNLEFMNEQLLQDLKTQTDTKEELVKELGTLKSAHGENEKEENKERTERIFIDSDVQTEEEVNKTHTNESSLLTVNDQLTDYEQQVALLRNVIAKLGINKNDVSRSDSIPELKDVVVSQRMKLTELTQEIDKMTSAMAEKEALINKYEQSIEAQGSLLRMKDEVIQMLTCKDAELMNVIEFLQNEIQNKETIVNEIKRQLTEKSEKIQKLISKLELKKAQIQHLESLITNLQKRSQNSISRMKMDDFFNNINDDNQLDERLQARDNQQPWLNVGQLLKLLEYEFNKSENVELQRIEHEARGLINEAPVQEQKRSSTAMKRPVFDLTQPKHSSHLVNGLTKTKYTPHFTEDENKYMTNFRSLFGSKPQTSVPHDENFVFISTNRRKR